MTATGEKVERSSLRLTLAQQHHHLLHGLVVRLPGEHVGSPSTMPGTTEMTSKWEQPSLSRTLKAKMELIQKLEDCSMPETTF